MFILCYLQDFVPRTRVTTCVTVAKSGVFFRGLTMATTAVEYTPTALSQGGMHAPVDAQSLMNSFP